MTYTIPPHRSTRGLLVGAFCIALASMNVDAQTTDAPLSDAESAPEKMGWMQGAPPPPDKRLSAADGSFFDFPAMRYSVMHMREFLPTTEVSRGVDDIERLPYALDPAIAQLTFTPRGTSDEMTWEESLPVNYTDAIIVLHRGQVVFERYRHLMDETKVHAAMSCTKSYVGTLASILAAEGKLDTAAMVTDYIPELEGSAFATATVRELMDMTTSLDYSEDYADKSAEIWQYAAATNPFPNPQYNGPVGAFEYLKTLQAKGEHGEAFAYKTPNADLTGWLVTRAGGAPLDEQLSERIWKPLGMEQSAYFQVDALGTPSAGGGLSAGLRDMARFGELVRNMGVYDGRQVIPGWPAAPACRRCISPTTTPVATTPNSDAAPRPGRPTSRGHTWLGTGR